jgi:hypothetical protein
MMVDGYAPFVNSLAAALPAHPGSREISWVIARTLDKHRSYGTGPKYRKIGGVYALAALKAWADVGLKQSTSDPGVGTVSPAKPILAAGCSRPHPPPRKRREPGSGSSDGSGSDSAA